MVWLLPHMKNEMTTKKELREALKKKKITKQDLLELINEHKYQESFRESALQDQIQFNPEYNDR